MTRLPRRVERPRIEPRLGNLDRRVGFCVECGNLVARHFDDRNRRVSCDTVRALRNDEEGRASHAA